MLNYFAVLDHTQVVFLCLLIQTEGPLSGGELCVLCCVCACLCELTANTPVLLRELKVKHDTF